ncbi:MAG: hypothetical protein QOJ93_1953 [Actinomycetota bacterium]|jgi:hypothetical protein|nr:hypothetical protein [Actinomycetota bacterium]
MSEEQAEQDPESSQELESLRTEVEGLHKRMEEIRAATEEEVLKNWQSPWKGADTVKAKVDSRLASNHEFRAIMTRARTAEATAAKLSPEAEATGERSPTGHPAIGR